ncbi:MAG: hypothetical protein WBZ29_09855 [Methanocella sp.]
MTKTDVLLEIGLISSLIMLLLAVDFLIWLMGATVLIGLLGWHPPGWLASPLAHGINTGFAIAGGAVAVMLPVVLDLVVRRVI